MADSDTSMISFVSKIFDIGVIKFGEFTLKSGVSSPVYIDFRLLVSYPHILNEACELLGGIIDRKLVGKFDKLCGVPFAALPIASVISSHKLIPMVMRRQQVKSHGTGKKIEGSYKESECILVVEDVVTSGGSVLETVRDLREVGLCVSHTLVLLDRQQGGVENLAGHGITVHSLLTLDLILDSVEKSHKLSAGEIARVRDSLRSSTPTAQIPIVKKGLMSRLDALKHPVSMRLAGLVKEKRSNLVLSADVSTCAEVLQLAEQLGPYICMLKLHTDALKDLHASPAFIQELQTLSVKHNYLLCEDRKLADIGSTAARQYELLGWADLVTVHSVAGPGVLGAIRRVLTSCGQLGDRGCLLITEMSCEGNLITKDYTHSTLQLAEEYSDCVAGLICQKGADKPASLLCLTPGVKLSGSGGDGLFQTYTDPSLAVRERGADLLIVGRGILEAPDRVQTAKLYAEAGYSALTT